MLKFTKDHEWLRLDGDTATVGITAFAAGELGELVYVELPEVGAKLEPGGVAATVESVKAASEVYAPLGGEVTGVNTALAENPGLVNEDPQGRGWLFTLKLADVSAAESLMDEAAYKAFTA